MKELHTLPRDHLDGVVKFVLRATRYWWVMVAVLVLGALAVSVYTLKIYKPRYMSQAIAYYQEGIQWTLGNEPSSKRVGARLKETLLAHARLEQIIKELNLFPRLVAAGKEAEAVE